MGNTEDIIKDIITRIVDNEVLKMKISEMEDIDFIKDLQFDSLMIMELIVAIEEKFGVEILGDTDCMEVFTSSKSLIAWINKRKG